jgi:hypothetical protein
MSKGRSSRVAFNQAPFLSIKHENYFHIYDDLFSPFQDLEITFVEIGVLNGGSLFMWKEFLGSNARIIGIDNNPEAIKFREFGFEIFIGDQSSSAFWESFFNEIGNIDILLDDGGHTNMQQITTVLETIKNVNDGGLIVIEDTHASYMKSYGNPSRNSFVNFAKLCVDLIASRFQDFESKENIIVNSVYQISFLESITVFKIDKTRAVRNVWAQNSGANHHARDFRYSNESKVRQLLILIQFVLKFEYSVQAENSKKVQKLNRFMKLRPLNSFLALLFRPATRTIENVLDTELFSRRRKLRGLFSELSKSLPKERF